MNTKQTLLLPIIAALLLSGCGAVQLGIIAPSEPGAVTAVIPTPESRQKEQDTLSKATPESEAVRDETEKVSGNSPAPTPSPNAGIDSETRSTPEPSGTPILLEPTLTPIPPTPSSTPLPGSLQVIHTRFWPESDTADHGSAFDFGASVTFTNSDTINAGVTAFGLKAGIEASPDPNNCDEWTIPVGRPFWHDQESYSAGQHTFSRDYKYADDPEYTHLVVWIRLWQEKGNLYCEQRIYALPSPTSMPITPEPTSTVIPTGLHLIDTNFWPASGTVDRDTLSRFGASIAYDSSYDTKVLIAAYGLKEGEAIPDPSTCTKTIPEGRPSWSTGGEDFPPGQHTVSREFAYEDDPDYTHLVIWVRVSGGGEEHCDQQVYVLE
ncbi:MAG: hypothetical protein JW918_05205 [Anaerolineae bacterium]|nr:hypothetical protein [Anaerolineae bacterium]